MVPLILLKRIMGGRTRRIINKRINSEIKYPDKKINCEIKYPDKTRYRTQHPIISWKSKKSL